MSAWKPGDVAMVRIDGSECIGLRDTHGWATCNQVGDRSHFRWTADALVEPVRRLAVVDPEDWQEVERLTMLNLACYGVRQGTKPEATEIRHMQDGLREFVKPQPTRGTVVSAEQVKALLRQVETDREQDYWAEGHPDILDAAHAYLSSLADHLGVTQ